MNTCEWSKRAETELAKCAKYCVLTFGKKIAHKFVDSINHHAQLLSNNPHLGATERLLTDRKREYRSIVVHEYFKLIYFHNEKKSIIYIVDLWDTRREPRKLSQRVRSK